MGGHSGLAESITERLLVFHDVIVGREPISID